MGRKRNTREKIQYRFDQTEKTLRRVAGYLQEITELASTRSVIITGKVPPLYNACIELADIARDLGEQFSRE